MAGGHQCVCPVGQQCSGVCSSSDMSVVESGRQNCQGLYVYQNLHTLGVVRASSS